MQQIGKTNYTCANSVGLALGQWSLNYSLSSHLIHLFNRENEYLSWSEFIFMQFLAKNLLDRLAYSPSGVGAPPGNPTSTTTYDAEQYSD